MTSAAPASEAPLCRHVRDRRAAKERITRCRQIAPFLMRRARSRVRAARLPKQTGARPSDRFERRDDLREPDACCGPRQAKTTGASARRLEQTSPGELIEDLGAIIRGHPHLALHGHRWDERVRRLLREISHDAKCVFRCLGHHWSRWLKREGGSISSLHCAEAHGNTMLRAAWRRTFGASGNAVQKSLRSNARAASHQGAMTQSTRATVASVAPPVVPNAARNTAPV